jgi:hypothetical protein
MYPQNVAFFGVRGCPDEKALVAEIHSAAFYIITQYFFFAKCLN